VSVASASDKLELNGATTYAGGSFTGSGILKQDADASVTDDTTISVATYDWDGGGATATVVNSGKTFTLNVTEIDDGNDVFNGTLSLNGGELSVNNAANAWTMAGTMNLDSTSGTPTVSGDKMIVTGTVDVTGGFNRISAEVDFESGAAVSVSGGGTTLEVTGAQAFNAGSNTTVSAGGRLELDGPTTWNGPATVTGGGVVSQGGEATVTAGTTITVATYDWDGGGVADTTTNVNLGATFTLNVNQIDLANNVFDGTINNSGALSVTVAAGEWTMDGTLNMDNAGAVPTVSGSKMIVSGNVAVGGGEAHINSAVHFQSGAVVSLPAGTELELNGQTTFDGGSYTGDGVLRQDGAATVNSPTTISVDTYDMDGTYGTTQLTLNESLTLNVNRVDTVGATFDGTLNINNPGELTVGVPWTMAGTMNLDQNGHANKYMVKGSDVTVSGQVNVTDATAVSARMHLTGTINLGAAGDYFQFAGSANTVNGGSVVGPGRIGCGGGSLTGNGTISADVDFAGSADLLADGGTLSVSGAILGVGTIGTASAGGKLDVTNAWNTGVANRLELNGGEVTGGEITNDGETTGHGTITAAAFVNNGTLTAGGGTLTLSTTSFPDLDGSGAEGGTINTGAATIHATGSFGGLFNFNGALNVQAGGEFRMDSSGLIIASAGTPGQMNMSGGRYTAPRFVQRNVLTVQIALSTIDSDSDFQSGSTNTLNADLRLMGTAVIRNGASFSGSGELIVAAGATLNIEDGASLGVGLVNNGLLNPGLSVGTVQVLGDFTQGAAGTLAIELAGTAAGEFDLLDASGSAALAGALDVSLLGGFVPSSDAWVILEADGGITGSFSSVTAGYTTRLIMGDTALQLLFGLMIGDMDGSGAVNNNDITPFVLALSDRPAYEALYPGIDADVVGDIDASGALNNNDITPFVNLLSGPQAVPEPATTALLGLGVLALIRRRLR